MVLLGDQTSDARDRGDVMATSDNKTADTDEKIFIGKGEQTAWLTLALANRHGLVTGATGTGKTVSLQVMAEGFARAGVPVFAADIKGDLSGISAVGEAAGCLRIRRWFQSTGGMRYDGVAWRPNLSDLREEAM